MLERTIWTFAFASGTSKTFTLNHSYKNYKLVLDNAYLPEILYSCRNQHYSSSYRSTGQHALFQSLGGDRTVTSCGKHRRIDLCCTNNRRRVNAAQVSMFRHYPDHADLPCKVPWNISQLCSPQSDLPSPKRWQYWIHKERLKCCRKNDTTVSDLFLVPQHAPLWVFTPSAQGLKRSVLSEQCWQDWIAARRAHWICTAILKTKCGLDSWQALQAAAVSREQHQH